nr:hypothetical protein [Tanacetum cinerariifolium]
MANFNAKDYATLIAHPSPFRKFTEPFLRLVRLICHYTLDEDTYPWFVDRNREAGYMDLFAFIHISDPTKVRVVERERAKGEPRVLETTAPFRCFQSLLIVLTNLSEEDVGVGEPRRLQKKRKLKSDYGALNVVADAGKSPSDLGDLLARSMLMVESGVKVAATLLFVISSVSATSECDIGVPTAPERFLISSDSSHHSFNASEAESDSIIRVDVVPPMSLRDELSILNERNAILEMERNALDWKATDLEDSVMGKEHSFEYLFALGAAIMKAIEKGMQDGLAVRITHCAEGRTLADVAGYNPSAKAKYVSALQHLQSVDFSLLSELRSNKDASIDTLMNILRLEDTLAERLGCIGSQTHVDQLMFLVHHTPDKVVVGATSMSFALDVSNARVWKIKENIMSEGSAPRDVFIPLFEPFSSEVLTGTGGTSKTVPAIVTTTLSTTLAFASIIAPITVDDYGVVGMDGQASADGM